mmetsp:Transcript_12886/g.41172  ORF Transcript_12886/g.41172 Transcript_12886/m.41172 type:complete len:247 (+) Transcript_12886:269-1009(+)
MGGIISLRPLRFRMPVTSSIVSLLVKGSPGIVSQWWKTSCGKAWPPVFWRRKEVKPNDSETGRYALTVHIGVPGRLISSTTWPRLRVMDEYACPLTASGHWISHMKTGSCSRGDAVIIEARKQRRAVGMIWPPPRWMVSACSTTSWMWIMTSRHVSSQSGPSLHTHCQPATTESLISFRYCTPTVTSTTRLGPVPSGPKHQIFCVVCLSQPNLSTSTRVRAFGSMPAETSPSSMASARGVCASSSP